MNEAVREMFPPNLFTWEIRYSRSKVSRASRSAMPMISPPFSHFRVAGVADPISGGSCSARIASRGSPAAMIRIQSMTLRS